MTTKQIVDQVVEHVTSLVVDQSRYQFPGITDELYEAASEPCMTDEETMSFLEGTPIVSRENILELISQLPVGDWYRGTRWVETVAEYCNKHHNSCAKLIAHLHTLVR